MYVTYVIVTVVTIAANTVDAVASYLKAGFALANSAEVGVPRSWLSPLATLKVAGAAGLLAGLLGFHGLAVAAATGLVLFFVGATAAHVRGRVFHNIGGALGFLALAVASLVLAAGR
ncbi:DoxX family protein [Streptomyces sp. I05A-00742]|uniref:DoxX family protein n=1 Tax=Streptomyces sp. I05A-00742 TaxID=2732853 RepID=UPI001488FC3C|nr:DoxX family protein [Streptomyces sp. I05A-00742]